VNSEKTYSTMFGDVCTENDPLCGAFGNAKRPDKAPLSRVLALQNTSLGLPGFFRRSLYDAVG
jgi:hypothetical protein